jgi:hypothetical protein
VGFSNNPIIGLIIAPDLVLRLPVSGRKKEDDLVTAAPDIMRWIGLGIADVLADGVVMRSHDTILSDPWAKSSILLVCHQDQPRTTMKYMAIDAAITTMTSVRFSGSLIQGRRFLSNILSSFTGPALYRRVLECLTVLSRVPAS